MTSFTSSYGKKMLRASISGQTLAKVPRIDSLSSDHYWCESGLDQDGFCKMFINQYIGFGVFATKTFYKGDFLLEYVGERISLEEAVEREKKRKNNRCYMYYFRYREKTCCIDATDTNNRLCRYVNDSAVKSAKCNSKMKLKVFNSNYPRLCLYATKTIPKGQEIRYDYGDADKNLEWRNLNKSCNKIPVESDSDSDPFELNQPKKAVSATKSNPNSSNDKCDVSSSKREYDSSSESEYDSSSESECGYSSSDSEYDDSSSESEDEMEGVLTQKEDGHDDADGDIHDRSNKVSTKLTDDDSSFEKDLIQREDGLYDDDDDDDEYCPTELSTESSTDDDSSSEKDLIQKEDMCDDDDDDDDDDDNKHYPTQSSTNNGCSFEKAIHNKNVHVSDSENEDKTSAIFPVLSQEKKIVIQAANKNSKGNLSNKCHACVFCGIVLPNISRHLSLKHQNEIEVAKILALPKRSMNRRKCWEELVNRGDFAHNYAVIEKGHGMIIPKYRQNDDSVKVTDFVPCFHCKALYKKSDLWKHQSSCVAKDPKDSDREHIKNGSSLLPCNSSSKILADKVFLKMQNDDVKLTVEQDKRIINFGERLLKKHGPQEHKIQYISQKLRELGRLVVCCKSVSNVKSVDDVLKSCNWDVLIKCIKIVAGYDEQSQMFKTPSLALKIGQSLEKCARYKRSDAIKENNKCKQKEAEDFLCLYTSDWKDDVSSVALNSLDNQKYNKTQMLPLTDDVVKLNKYLESTANSLCKKIGNNPDLYSKLSQVLLTQVILFNRRRSGEAERMLLEGFNDAIKNGSGRPDPVVMSTLTEFEKRLCTSHTRVEIRGKRGRKVPVLLTDKMRQQIEVLIDNRNKANVKQPYLFARPGEFTKPYRGSDCLRKLSKEAGVEHPSSLTSTKLRKQLATLAQVLNLSENSQDILATFQGHDIRVHREFYRLPENASQAAKVTKILHSINNGTIAKYKGKDFDEIEFVPEKEILESESESETEDLTVIERDVADVMDFSESDENEALAETPKTVSKKRTVAMKKNCAKAATTRHKWNKKEKMALECQFRKNINLEKVPCKLECLNAIKNQSCLSRFTWKNIKYAVKNLITSRRRSLKKC